MTAQWDAEFVIDEALVAELLRDQFEELAACPRRKLGEGWDCVAWLIDNRWVFRFPRRRLGAECLANEIQVVPAMARLLPLPVSTPELVGRPTTNWPWPFAGCPLISGASLCETRIPDDQRTRIAGQLATFLRSLHAVDANHARSLGAGPDTIARLNVPHRTGRARESITRAIDLKLMENSLSQKLLGAIEGISLRKPEPRMHSLVHGDLYSRHIYVDSGAVTGIIDWGDVHAGDPAVDLAVCWTMFSGKARDLFWSEYGDIDDTTRDLARLRAIGHSLSCLLYAHDVGDQPLLSEAFCALARVISE